MAEHEFDNSLDPIDMTPKTIKLNIRYEYDDEDAYQILRFRIENEKRRHAGFYTPVNVVRTAGVQVNPLLTDDFVNKHNNTTVLMVYHTSTITVVLAFEFEDGACRGVTLIGDGSQTNLTPDDANILANQTSKYCVQLRHFNGLTPARPLEQHNRLPFTIENAVHLIFRQVDVTGFPTLRMEHAFYLAEYNPDYYKLFMDKQLVGANPQQIKTFTDNPVCLHYLYPSSIPIRKTRWSQLIAGITEELSPKMVRILVNPYYCYECGDIELILRLRLAEERLVHSELLQDVYATQVVSIEHTGHTVQSQRMYIGGVYICYGDLVNAIRCHLDKVSLSDQRILVPLVGFYHAFGCLIEFVNNVCVRIVAVDSSGAVEEHPEYLSVVMDQFGRVVKEFGGVATITWRTGLQQTGGTCTVYAVENLILAAKDQLRLLLRLHHNPLLIRLHHLRVVWEARHQEDDCRHYADRNKFVDIFEDFHGRQACLSKRNVPITHWDVPLQGMADDRFDNVPQWGKDGLISVIENTIDDRNLDREYKRMMVFETLDSYCVFVEVHDAFLAIPGYFKPLGVAVIDWIKCADVEEESLLRQEGWLDKECPWAYYFLYMLFECFLRPVRGHMLLRKIRIYPNQYRRHIGTVSLTELYKELETFVCSKKRFHDSFNTFAANATENEKNFCDFFDIQEVRYVKERPGV